MQTFLHSCIHNRMPKLAAYPQPLPKRIDIQYIVKPWVRSLEVQQNLGELLVKLSKQNTARASKEPPYDGSAGARKSGNITSDLRPNLRPHQRGDLLALPQCLLAAIRMEMILLHLILAKPSQPLLKSFKASPLISNDKNTSPPSAEPPGITADFPRHEKHRLLMYLKLDMLLQQGQAQKTMHGSSARSNSRAN